MMRFHSTKYVAIMYRNETAQNEQLQNHANLPECTIAKQVGNIVASRRENTQSSFVIMSDENYKVVKINH